MAWLLSGGTPALNASAFDWSAFVAATSDYLYRGASQTDGEPALQAGVSLEHASGAFVSLWTSNVEFAFESFGSEEPRDREIDIAGGYVHQIGASTDLSAQVRYYWYPNGSIGYDYTEIAMGVRHRSVWAGVAWIDDFGGSPGWAYEVAYSRSLPYLLDFSAGLGWLDVESLFVPDYPYWSAVVTRPLGRSGVLRRLEASVGVYGTDSRARRELSERVAGTKAVVGISWLLWPAR